MRELVLGSSSPFRRELLDRLGLSYVCDSPEIDESRLPDETAEDLVIRLSEAKAAAVAERHPNAIIIGSDQVAVLDGEILGKPGNHEKAIEQLSAAAGRKVVFYTGLCVLDSATGQLDIALVPFTVYFRDLSTSQIERYLQKERPYNCAGSFKSEGLGIALFEKLEGSDPNALIGLPMIELITMLNSKNIDVLSM